MNTLEYIKKYELDDLRDSVINRMESLARDLKEEVEMLKQDSSRKLWSNGFVQGRGMDIDRGCAEWATKVELLRKLQCSMVLSEKECSK